MEKRAETGAASVFGVPEVPNNGQRGGGLTTVHVDGLQVVEHARKEPAARAYKGEIVACASHMGFAHSDS